MNKIQIKLQHGATAIHTGRKVFSDSGFDLTCQGYVDKDGKEIWFDELSDRERSVMIMGGENIKLLTGTSFGLPDPEPIYRNYTLLEVEDNMRAIAEDREVTDNREIIGWNVMDAEITGKSGLSVKKNTTVKKGTADNGYTGDYTVSFHNNNRLPLKIEEGLKIAQVIFKWVYVPTESGVVYVDEIKKDTTRGSNGFGSTGAFKK